MDPVGEKGPAVAVDPAPDLEDDEEGVDPHPVPGDLPALFQIVMMVVCVRCHGTSIKEKSRRARQLSPAGLKLPAIL